MASGTRQRVLSPGIWMVTAGPGGTHSRHAKKDVEVLNALCILPKNIFFFLPIACVLKDELYSAAAPKEASSPPRVRVTHLGKISAHT